jgi:uncharacterized membrane protein YfcA
MFFWLGLMLIGLVAGVLSGMFGIGGGIIIVFALVAFLGLSPVEAISTSLAVLMLPVGIFAVLEYDKQKLLDRRAALWIVCGMFFASALGALGALQLEALDPVLPKRAYGLFALLMSWRFVEPRQWLGLVAAKTPRPERTSPLPAWQLLGIGGAAGFGAGLFGIGGGVIIVPMLTLLLGYDQKKAVGTSLGALLLPFGLPGVLVYIQNGALDLRLAGGVALGLLLGAFIGARVALALPSATVKRAYGFFLIFVGWRFLVG